MLSFVYSSCFERLWLSALPKACDARNVIGVLSEYPKQFYMWAWRRYDAADRKDVAAHEHLCSSATDYLNLPRVPASYRRQQIDVIV